MLKRILKLKMLVQSAVVLPLIFGAFQAQAMYCEPYDDYSETVTIPIIGSGIITAGEDLPIGSALYVQNYTPNSAASTGWRCKDTYGEGDYTVSPYLKAEAINTPMGLPVLSGGRSLFPTNVPGIGIAIEHRGHGAVFPYVQTLADRYVSAGVGHGSGTGLSKIRISLVKTGPIASSAQILASSFPTIQFSEGITQPVPYAFESPYLTINFSGVINVVSRSCEVTDVDVDMGKYPLSYFKGDGTTTDWKDFQITLRNCPPFYGRYANESLVYTDDNGITSQGAPTANYMQLTLSPTNGYYTNPNVILLDSDSDSATGIGIQIADENETLLSMIKNQFYTPNLQLTNVDGATYVLPLKARYYQYRSTVTGGKANASVIYTISYY